MQLCTTCSERKDLREFNKDNRKLSGYSCLCKLCGSLKKKEYYKTKKGLASRMYESQKYYSKIRKHPTPSYPKEVFVQWIMQQSEYHFIYDKWLVTNYNKDFKPSIDRINDYLPYTLENIQLTTWKENIDRGHKDIKDGINNKVSVAVDQFSLGDVFIRSFHSMSEANRILGVSQGGISSACKGKQITAGGYKWKHSNYLIKELV